jgi:hypothetical protein
MACNVTLTGIGYSCEPNLAGVKAVYIADYNDVSAYTVNNNNITSITMASGKKFYEYVFNKNTAGLTSTMTKDETNGYSFYTNELTGNINHLDTTKHIEVNELMSGRLACIVNDKNGMFWFLGQDTYATGTAMVAQTGAAPEDGNYYNITVTDESKVLPYSIDSSIISGIVSTPSAADND